MRVRAEIDEITQENEEGQLIDSVSATCSRCEHETVSYGTSDESIKRCLALLREECPEGENNFYVSNREEE
jgi:hypothetical protein